MPFNFINEDVKGSVVNTIDALIGESDTRQLDLSTGSNDYLELQGMIIEDEGVEKSPYQDSLNRWTIGVGHLIGDGSSPGEYKDKVLTDEEVSELFDKDFKKHLGWAQETPNWEKANRNQQRAMVNLTFNMGKWWKKTKKDSNKLEWPLAVAALKEGEFDEVADQLVDSKWYTQVGDRSRRVVQDMRGY